MSQQPTRTATPSETQPATPNGPQAPRVTHKIVNGKFLEGQGEKYQHRLCMSEDCDWYIEFDGSDGNVNELSTASGKPTHSVELKLDAEIFRGKFSNAETFLTFGVDKQRGRGDGVYDDWYTDPTSRGMGC